MSASLEHESASQRRSRVVAERKEAERKAGRTVREEKIAKKATEDAIRVARLEAQAIEGARKLAEFADVREQGETRRLHERELYLQEKVHAEEMTRAAEVANRTAKLEAQAIEKAQKAAVFADARDRGEENMKLEVTLSNTHPWLFLCSRIPLPLQASIKISSKLQQRRDIRAHERALVLREDVHLVLDLDDFRIFIMRTCIWCLI
jgi:hypothetical protein